MSIDLIQSELAEAGITCNVVTIDGARQLFLTVVGLNFLGDGARCAGSTRVSARVGVRLDQRQQTLGQLRRLGATGLAQE